MGAFASAPSAPEARRLSNSNNADTAGFSTAPSSPRPYEEPYGAKHSVAAPDAGPSRSRWGSSSTSGSGKAKRGAPAAEAPLISGFHPKSELPTTGYEGALTEAQENALSQLRVHVDTLGLAEAVSAAAVKPAETEDGLLLRFLRARSFYIDKALALLRAHLAWRREMRVDELRDMTEAEVLGCDPVLLQHYLPTYNLSFDRQGRPVQFTKWGDLRVDEVLKHTDADALVRHHVWAQEKLMARLAESAGRNGVWVPQCVIVSDAKYWHPGLATRTAMAFLKRISAVDQDQYVERMGAVVCINAPYTLSACWAIISTWLDPVTRAKVNIISSERYWKPLLAELMDESQIPEEYGGTLEGVQMRDIGKREPPPILAAAT